MSDSGDDSEPPGRGEPPLPPPPGAGDANWHAGHDPPPETGPAAGPASPPVERGGGGAGGGTGATLGPMGPGDVLDGTVRTLVGRWRVVLGAVAAVSIPVQLLFVVVAPETATTGPVGAFSEGFAAPGAFEPDTGPPVALASLWRAQAFALVQLAVVSPLIAGAVVHIVGGDRLGRPTGVGTALRAALGRLHALVAVRVLLMLLGLIVVGTVAVASGALVAGLGAVGIAVAVVLGLAAMAGAAGAFVLFATVTPAVMLERLGPLAAMGRSMSLVRRRYWPTLGKVALVTLLVGIVSQTLSLVALAAELLPGSAAYVAASTLVGVVTAPLLPIALTLVYLDLRVRTEGLDLAAALDQPDPGGPAG